MIHALKIFARYLKLVSLSYRILGGMLTVQVVASIQRDPHDSEGGKLFTVKELDWFCKNSYNIGIQNISTWESRQIVRLFRCCLSIIASYPQDVGAQVSGDIALRAMFCHFVIAAALISLARCEDNLEVQLQDYLEMRKHVKAFDSSFEKQLETLDDLLVQDIRAKLSTMLVFDIEAAICLKSWDDLGEIALKAEGCKDLVAFQAMADCILRAQSIPVQGKSKHVRPW
jgi:hypothetical protein